MIDNEKQIKEMMYDIGPIMFIEHNGEKKPCIFYSKESLTNVLVGRGWTKLDKDSVVLSKEEYERLHSIEIAFEEFAKPDGILIPTEEYEVLKIKEKEKHWLNTCISVWENAKIDGSKETAVKIYRELQGHGTTYVKKWIEKQFGVEIKE